MKFLVEKQGFKDSAAIFNTHAEAKRDADVYWPEIPYTIRRITDSEAQERTRRHLKRIRAL